MTRAEYAALRRLYRTLRGEATKAWGTPQEAAASANLSAFFGLVTQLHGCRLMESLQVARTAPCYPVAEWPRRYRRRDGVSRRPYAARTAPSPHCAVRVLPLP